MKTPYTFFWAMLFFGSISAQTVPVTFQVDMNNQTVDPALGVHVAGNFQGWDPAATVMSDDDMDGVYEVTYDIADSLSLIEYKFVNGNDWGMDESAPEACSWNGGGNRHFELDGEVTLEAPCFGQCAACGITTVLFKVDMSQLEAINPIGVHMNGNFNENGAWSATDFLPMDDSDGDLIYTYVAQMDGAMLETVDTALFKFVNGNVWDFAEGLEGECTINGDRFLALDGGDMVYELAPGQPYCYNACASCVSPTPVTFKVDMSTQAEVSVNGVCVAGSFQGWTAGLDFLSDDDGDLVYELTTNVPPGDYEFKFINGNNWGGDGEGNVDNENPPGECVTNGNRNFTVGAEAITVQYCYNQCSETCVEDPNPAPITFQVDMANETVSENGVWLIGGITTPQWQAGALQMSDNDGDNLYEVTYEVSGSAFFEYRYCNGDPYPGGTVDDAVAELGDFDAGGCGQANPFGEANRTHTRSGEPEVLGAYCFTSCLDCNGDTVGTVIGVEEVEDWIGLEVYPNPAQDILNVRVNGFEGLADVRAFDLAGRVVLSERAMVSRGTVLRYTTEAFETGVYILEVRSGLKRSVIRLTAE